MPATAEIAFVSEFTCRHCGTGLIGRTRERSAWLRCPKCGRATLPRELMTEPSSRFAPLPDDPPDDLLVIGPAPELPAMTPVGAAFPLENQEGGENDTDLILGTSVRRVVASTILFLSLTMLVLSILDQSPYGGTIFGTTAMAALVLLLWPVSTSRRS